MAKGNPPQWIPAHLRYRCEQKQPYASEGEARAVAAMRGMTLHAYACGVCGFWHLTRRGPRDAAT